MTDISCVYIATDGTETVLTHAADPARQIRIRSRRTSREWHITHQFWVVDDVVARRVAKEAHDLIAQDSMWPESFAVLAVLACRRAGVRIMGRPDQNSRRRENDEAQIEALRRRLTQNLA
ncbi:MAG: hypothetical protein KF895_03050 [Parvibaculum sp.]|nr:hypothetical protein [Parvibaculum sp.]